MKSRVAGVLGAIGMTTLCWLVGCETQSSSEPQEQGPLGVVVLQHRSELPRCGVWRRGVVFYVQSSEELMYCDGRDYQPVQLDGVDGAGWVLATTPAPDCPAGGVVLVAGPDTDGDGQMDSVTSTDVVCNGVDGEDGEDGTSYLIRTETAPMETCANGGTVFFVGPDEDGDGTLSPEETTSSSAICNGLDGGPIDVGAGGAGGATGNEGGAGGVTPGGGGIPNACFSGLSGVESGDPWVVCAADETTAWVSSNNSGVYNIDVVCQSLGYVGASQWGGTCGNVCGFCEGPTACDAPGTRFFDGGSGCNPPDTHCYNVMWECSN